MRQRQFLIFILSVSLLQSSHAVLYVFGTIHWRSAGISDALIGVLWAEGVVAEIILFAFSASVLARLTPIKLMWIAAIAGLLRWTILRQLNRYNSAVRDPMAARLNIWCRTSCGDTFYFTDGTRTYVRICAEFLFRARNWSRYGTNDADYGLAYDTYGGGAFYVMILLSAGGGGGAFLLSNAGWAGR